MNQITNNKQEDKLRANTKPSKQFIENNKHYCGTCKDTVCCNKGKDKYAYCCGGPE